MTSVSQSIPNLIGGVSQQPDTLKVPGQVRRADNAFLDPTFGCKKRPPTSWISKLGNEEIPEDTKWFPIFRDQSEKYVCVIYRDDNGDVILRVWDTITGLERTVDVVGTSALYLQTQDFSDISTISVGDYTLIANRSKEITIDTNSIEAEKSFALVAINQVAYNTRYQLDILKDGELSQEKVFKASKLSITPATFEVTGDEGACSLADVESFVEDGSGSKTGLAFTIRTTCNPTLVTEETDGTKYPTSLQNGMEGARDKYGWQWGQSVYANRYLGQASERVSGSYGYHSFTTTTPAGAITVRAEFVVRTDDNGYQYWELAGGGIVSYDTEGSAEWATGMDITDSTTAGSTYEQFGGQLVNASDTCGIRFYIGTVNTAPTAPDYSYKSVYKTKVTLNNGGTDWAKGDKVSVTMSGKQYTVTVEEVTFGYAYDAEASIVVVTPADASAGALTSADIVTSLVTDINALAGFEATSVGNVIKMSRTDDRDFNIFTSGGIANSALTGIKSAVNDVSQLPEQCFPNTKLKVRNTNSSDADDYYVEFESDEGDIPGYGSWIETVAPDVPTDLNAETMPHVIIRNADGTFTFRPLSEEFDDEFFWKSRAVGDEETNPEPSFVGQGISGMFFYYNRLGFLTEDAVVMSRPGDFFNFFQNSAIAVSDADPIDLTTSSTRPSILKSAVGTSKGLLLFAENSQFLMSTPDTVFGPATVQMAEIGNYSYNSKVDPVETGVSIMFSTEAETYTKVFEMAVDSIDNRPIVAENTRIIPEYIPPNVKLISSSPNNSLVLIGDGTRDLYVFKFFNTGNERNLAGWTKWVMPADVQFAEFDHDTLYIVQRYDPQKYVVDLPEGVPGPYYFMTKMEMLDDPDSSPISVAGKQFIPRVDNQISQDDVTLTPVPDTTLVRVTLPDGIYIETLPLSLIFTVGGESTLFQQYEPIASDNGYYFDIQEDL